MRPFYFWNFYVLLINVLVLMEVGVVSMGKLFGCLIKLNINRHGKSASGILEVLG